MTQFVALLRGVNVGGINIKMADVRQVFENLGLSSVRTVLASGNVLFESDQAAPELKPVIERALGAQFGYEAWVHVLEVTSIRSLIEAYPFDAEKEGWHPYVIFAPDADVSAELLAASDSLEDASESIAGGDGVIYWTVERGNSLGSVFAKRVGRARYKSTTTTRNLRTLRKLVD